MDAPRSASPPTGSAQAEQGGFYQAVATGAYAKRMAWTCTIVQGGPGVNVPQLLASRRASIWAWARTASSP
jgi:hypothetical protein